RVGRGSSGARRRTLEGLPGLPRERRRLREDEGRPQSLRTRLRPRRVRSGRLRGPPAAALGRERSESLLGTPPPSLRTLLRLSVSSRVAALARGATAPLRP